MRIGAGNAPLPITLCISPDVYYASSMSALSPHPAHKKRYPFLESPQKTVSFLGNAESERPSRGESMASVAQRRRAP
jgi:hypothetical protein